MSGAAKGPIDRDTTTPLLLRVFWNTENHHSENSYRDGVPENELHFYTWKDATLKELSELLKDVIPAARKKAVRLNFSLVYPDREGKYKLRFVGTVRNVGQGVDDNKALRDISFETGDYLDIAILEGRENSNNGNLRDGGRGPPMRGPGGGGRGGYGGFANRERGGGGSDWGRRDGGDGGFRRRNDLAR